MDDEIHVTLWYDAGGRGKTVVIPVAQLSSRIRSLRRHNRRYAFHYGQNKAAIVYHSRYVELLGGKV